jgi:hypothetical protein
VTTKEQRKLLATPAAPPQYILGMQLVRSLLTELQGMMEKFNKAMATVAPPQNAQVPPQVPPAPPKPPGPGPAPSVVEGHPPPAVQMPQSSQPLMQSRMVPPPTQQIAKGTRKPGLVATSTPSPAAHTPVHAAATPPTIPVTSPRTPKSPPKKAAAKPKPPPKRRASKAGQQQPDIGPGKSAPTKRPREEEPAPQGAASQPDAAQDEPSPKRPKREDWDGPPSESLEKHQQEMDGIESNQDVQAYLARATEDFLFRGKVKDKEGASDDLRATEDFIVSDKVQGDEGAPVDLPQTLQELFKGVPIFEVPDSFPGTSAESATVPSSPKPTDNALDLLDFFDFSQCEPDEPVASTSKIDTPDLVHVSSTNPSPESVAQTPKGDNAVVSGRAKDVKVEDINGPNPLALGVWGEINGGESAYFHSPTFKWEGNMPVQDAPWAMSAGT